MRCPKCHSILDRVVDTRPQTDFSVRRRRECYVCGLRWNTIEITLELFNNLLEKESKLNIWEGGKNGKKRIKASRIQKGTS